MFLSLSAYFEFVAFSASQERLSFLLTPITGAANLYVSSGVYPQTGVPSSYFDTKSSNQVPQKIDVTHNTPRACHPEQGTCRYRIGVYGLRTCSFTVTVLTDANTRLLNGIPQPGRLTGYAWNYYELFVPFGMRFDLSIVVTPLAGQGRGERRTSQQA